METKIVKVGNDKVNQVKIGENLPLVFIGGPCAIESHEHAFKMAKMIGEI